MLSLLVDSMQCGQGKREVFAWAWVKIKPAGDRRFQSMFPFTRVPFWVYPILDPQPRD